MGLLTAQKHFRRIKGHGDLPQLVAALRSQPEAEKVASAVSARNRFRPLSGVAIVVPTRFSCVVSARGAGGFDGGYVLPRRSSGQPLTFKAPLENVNHAAAVMAIFTARGTSPDRFVQAIEEPLP